MDSNQEKLANQLYYNIHEYVFHPKRQQVPIAKWNISKIKNFSFLFSIKPEQQFENNLTTVQHNQRIHGIVNWNVVNVQNMNYMFFNFTNFNQDLNGWDVSGVKSMEGMFANCVVFDGNISGWTTIMVKSMFSMFAGCANFNQDISKWDVSQVEDMEWMFHGCSKFNQDISKWNVEKVTYFNGIFQDCPIRPDFKPPKFRTADDIAWIEQNQSLPSEMHDTSETLPSVPSSPVPPLKEEQVSPDLFAEPPPHQLEATAENPTLSSPPVKEFMERLKLFQENITKELAFLEHLSQKQNGPALLNLPPPLLSEVEEMKVDYPEKYENIDEHETRNPLQLKNEINYYSLLSTEYRSFFIVAYETLKLHVKVLIEVLKRIPPPVSTPKGGGVSSRGNRKTRRRRQCQRKNKQPPLLLRRTRKKKQQHKQRGGILGWALNRLIASRRKEIRDLAETLTYQGCISKNTKKELQECQHLPFYTVNRQKRYQCSILKAASKLANPSQRLPVCEESFAYASERLNYYHAQLNYYHAEFFKLEKEFFKLEKEVKDKLRERFLQRLIEKTERIFSPQKTNQSNYSNATESFKKQKAKLEQLLEKFQKEPIPNNQAELNEAEERWTKWLNEIWPKEKRKVGVGENQQTKKSRFLQFFSQKNPAAPGSATLRWKHT